MADDEEINFDDETLVALDAMTGIKLELLARSEEDSPDISEMARRLIHRAHRRMQNRLM